MYLLRKAINFSLQTTRSNNDKFGTLTSLKTGDQTVSCVAPRHSPRETDEAMCLNWQRNVYAGLSIAVMSLYSLFDLVGYTGNLVNHTLLRLNKIPVSWFLTSCQDYLQQKCSLSWWLQM